MPLNGKMLQRLKMEKELPISEQLKESLIAMGCVLNPFGFWVVPEKVSEEYTDGNKGAECTTPGPKN